MAADAPLTREQVLQLIRSELHTINRSALPSSVDYRSANARRLSAVERFNLGSRTLLTLDGKQPGSGQQLAVDANGFAQFVAGYGPPIPGSDLANPLVIPTGRRVVGDPAAPVTGQWWLGGDGSFRLARETTAQRVPGPVKGELHLNETDERVELYDGAGPGYRQLAMIGDESSGLGLNVLRGLSRQQGSKVNSLLAETIPWELAFISCNGRATPGGLGTVGGRLTLMAVPLEQGQVVTGLAAYHLAAFTTFTSATLSVWTYDGATFTCAAVVGPLNTGTGFRTGAPAYTVPATGIYFIGQHYLGTMGAGTNLGFVDAGNLTIVAGDFSGRVSTPGYTSTSWPRIVAFNGLAITPTVGMTQPLSASVFVTNFPWVGVTGTIL